MTPKKHILFLLFVFICFAFASEINDFIASEINLAILIAHLSVLILFLCFSLFFTTFKLRFDEKGIKGYVFLLSRKKSIDESKYIILWDKVTKINAPIAPLWTPFKFIGIYCIMEGKETFISYPGMLTNFKEALLFIEKQVSPDIIDDDVKRLLAKYKKRRKYPDIVFPIIIKDVDGYMYRVYSIKSIEYNDLYFNEFKYFWDMRADPLNIYLKERENSKSEIVVEIKEVLPEKEKLKGEIISFLKKYKKNINVKEIEDWPIEKLVDKIDAV
jgi:hypothetical protein